MNHLMFNSHNLAFFCFPRCASTSIKDAFAKALGTGFKELKYSNNRVTSTDIFYQGNDFFKAAVVRNPFERIGSAFQYANSVEVLGMDGIEDTMQDFSSLMDYIMDTPDQDINVHFRSMSWDLVRENRLLVNMVLRFEMLKVHWDMYSSAVSKWCSLRLSPLELLRPSGFVGKYEDLFTYQHRQWMRIRYSKDLQMFGYGY